ncbi:unnamed protein product [Urochloa decumbens]|uniref:F-box domain-containing protein n=1 Tax=Urochloa decumbens TaxID=240449 RepID=A0ABC9BD84_9POAL
MARRAPFPNRGPPPPAFDVRDTEHLVSYVSSCLPDPPVSNTARFSARRGGAPGGAPDGADRISGLSDGLLRDIVSRLPFKDAARTAVLATRWRRVWLQAPLAVADAHLLDHWPPTPADAPAITAAVSAALAAHPGPFRCAHLVSTRMDAHQPQLRRWLRLLAAKGVQELVLINRPGPRQVPLPDTLFRSATLTCLYIGFWKLPDAAQLQGASFPNLRELGICSVAVKDGDIDSLVARSPLLEILNIIQGNVKVLRLVGRSLRCVQICASVVESIAVVNAPCLERLVLWDVRGSHDPASGLRTRIKIGTAPKLNLLGYLDPAHHLLEIGGTTITAGIEPRASIILTSVKRLSLTACFGANDAMMVPAFLKCFPNVETLHIMSVKCDEPAGKLIKFWQEASPIVSVKMRIKMMTISEFRGEQHELAFVQSFFENARVLKYAAITAANTRVTGISDNQMFSILQKMDDSRWGSKFGLAVLGTNGPEGGKPWLFQRGADFSDDDPFAPVKIIEGVGPAPGIGENEMVGVRLVRCVRGGSSTY